MCGMRAVGLLCCNTRYCISEHVGAGRQRAMAPHHNVVVVTAATIGADKTAIRLLHHVVACSIAVELPGDLKARNS